MSTIMVNFQTMQIPLFMFYSFTRHLHVVIIRIQNLRSYRTLQLLLPTGPSQQTITCSKLATKLQKQGVKTI